METWTDYDVDLIGRVVVILANHKRRTVGSILICSGEKELVDAITVAANMSTTRAEGETAPDFDWLASALRISSGLWYHQNPGRGKSYRSMQPLEDWRY